MQEHRSSADLSAGPIALGSAPFVVLWVAPAIVAGAIASMDGVWAAATATVLALAAGCAIDRLQTWLKNAVATAAPVSEVQELLGTFHATLENMPQGVALYDSEQRIVLANRRYAEMYGLDADDIPVGVTMKEILEKRVAKGIFIGADAAHYVNSRVAAMERPLKEQGIERFADGRVIAKTRKPMPGGGWLSVHEDITERQRAEDRIAYLAHHDALTGLYNRAVLPERISEAFVRARRQGGQFAVLILDLDDFKVINDTMGHQVGDKLLQAAAMRLRAATREIDLVSRVGGDEFAIICECGARGADAAHELAQRVLESISQPYSIDGMRLLISACIGVAIAPGDGRDAESLMRNADLALYQAKSMAEPGVRLFNHEMDAAVRSERKLENDLQNAVAAGQIEVHYQAVVSIDSRRVTGMEALARWRHPTLGMVPPDRFIKIAERTGLIQEIGEFVLSEACREAMNWPDDVKIAVNLSPAQFKNGDVVEVVWRCLDRTGLPARRLTLEITETVLLEKIDGNLKLLRELKEIGCAIALDDFGTGYSSLGYLKTIPFDVIKIDRSFVAEMATNERSGQIVAGIVALSPGLGFTTVAEGVETEEQLDLVRAVGCTGAQGYYFARPLPASQLSFEQISPPAASRAA